MRRAVLLLIVLALIAAMSWAVTRRTSSEATSGQADSGAPQPTDWYVAQKQNFDLTVLASGELTAKDQVEVKNLVEGTTTITEIVEEGTPAKAGDVLARLADDQIRTRIEEQQLNVAKAEADKIAAEQNVYIQKNEAESNRKAGEVKLALAELDLAKWRNGDDPQKRREHKLALEKAKVNVERTKRDLELSERLFNEKFISQSEYEDDQIKAIEAQNALESAKLDIEVYDRYSFPKELRRTQSDVEQSKAELDRTTRRDESEVARAVADLQAKSGSLKIYQDRLAQLKSQLEATVIRAPKDGLVVYFSSVGAGRRRGDPIAAGKQLRFNETLILLPDTRHMVAALRVHEAMLPQIHNGLKAAVTIDARPGSPVEGTVYQIAVMAEDGGWVNPDLREYTVRVELPQELDGALKPAMRCTGRVLIGRVENAVAVPIQAVFTEGKQRLCYVADADGQRVVRQAITTGRASETLVEITDGLAEGTRVLLRKPRPGELVSE
jgi:HlyD family secretion protein